MQRFSHFTIHSGVPDAQFAEIPRPRVNRLLDTGRRIVLMSSLSGFGSTEAVAQWARSYPGSVHWVRAEAAHSSHGASGRGDLEKSVVEALVKAIDESGPFIDGSSDTAELPRRPPVVVLDDLEVDDPEDASRLGVLVENLSAHVRIVAITHSELNLPLATWRGRGYVTELEERHLAFDDAEALAVARAHHCEEFLSDDVVLRLNKALAGWPLAVVVALVAACGDHPGRELVLAQPHVAMSDYVMSEILGRLDPHDAQLAATLAVADRVDAELAHALVGDAAGALIDQLRRRRIVHDHLRRPGTVRFHPVIRGVLVDRLAWLDPARHQQLRRELAEWCLQRGHLGDAHQHLSAAGDSDPSTTLVMIPTIALSDAADRSGVIEMLGRLPGRAEVDHPMLAFDIGLAWVFAGSLRNARLWCERGEELMTGDLDEVVRRHATRTVVAMLAGELDVVMGLLDELEALEPRAGLGRPVEGILVSSALRSALAAGDIDRARTWLDQATITASNPVFALIVEALRAGTEIHSVPLRGPLERIERVTTDFAERGMRPHLGSFEAIVVETSIQLGAGRLDRAAECASEATAHAELLGFPWCRARAGAVHAETCLLHGGPMAALAAAREARLAIDGGVSRRLLDPIVAVEARALIQIGEPDRAVELAAAITDDATRALVLAAAALATHRHREVAGILVDARRWAPAERLAGKLLQAVALPATQGDASVAATVSEAASLGWVSPFLGHGTDVNNALRRLPLARLYPSLAAHFTAHAPADATRLHESMTRREQSILELLPSHLTYEEIAQTLGISVNTVKSNVRAIYRKLSAPTRSAAVQTARAHKLL